MGGIKLHLFKINEETEGGKNTTSNIGENIVVGLIVFGIVVFVCMCTLGTLCLYKWGCFPEFHG